MNAKHLRSILAGAAGLLAVCALSGFTASAADSGWYENNGKRHYRLEDGSDAVGDVTIDGVPYLFAPNGALQTGWQTVGGKRYYYDADGNAVFGWMEWRGERYYIDPEAGKITGSFEQKTEDGIESARFDAFGAVKTGFFAENGLWYYADENGILAESPVTVDDQTGLVHEPVMIDGLPYIFGEDSAIRTGFVTLPDGQRRYYSPETGRIAEEWFTVAGKHYYSDAESGILTGDQTVGGKRYAFDTDGAMFTGWYGGRYYDDRENGLVTGWRSIYVENLQYPAGNYVYCFDADGLPLSGAQTIFGKQYQFSDGSQNVPPSALITGFHTEADGVRYYSERGSAGSGLGVMLTGWQEIGGKRYHFNAQGVMAAGAHTISGVNYYFDENGAMQTGFVKQGDVTRYYSADGAMQTGWQEIGGNTYFFSADGTMKTGRYTNYGDSYYFDGNGVMQRGVVNIGGKLYLYGDDGRLQRGMVTYDGAIYYAGSDGSVTPGWLKLGTKRYYVSSTGPLLTYWQTIGDKEYYFGESGAAATGLTAINGYMYSFDENGVFQGADYGFTEETFKLVENAKRASSPIREIVIWDNGDGYCRTRKSFPTQKYAPLPSFKITDADIAIMEKFAAEHFSPSMTVTEKLWITHQWIHFNVDYAYDYTAEIWTPTYVDIIFNRRLGQCIQYNGAMASMLAYFGYDVYMVRGHTSSNSQHFWTEVLIDNKRYYVECGNYGKNGSWEYFFLPLAA